MSAAEWISKRRLALGFLSAYSTLREMTGDLSAAVTVGSMGVRGSDITAAEEDARTSLPKALDALEAVLATLPPAGAEKFGPDFEAGVAKGWQLARAAIESVLRGES